MVSGMAANENHDNRTADRKVVDDFMAGTGGKIFAIGLIILGIWFFVSLAW